MLQKSYSYVTKKYVQQAKHKKSKKKLIIYVISSVLIIVTVDRPCHYVTMNMIQQLNETLNS